MSGEWRGAVLEMGRDWRLGKETGVEGSRGVVGHCIGDIPRAITEERVVETPYKLESDEEVDDCREESYGESPLVRELPAAPDIPTADC